jgi:PAS domain S-box-containing protein
MDVMDYIKIFEQSSGLSVVVDTSFAIVAASDSFLKSTSTVRHDIVGRNIFEVFPDNPLDEAANGKSKVSDSFSRVLKHKVPDTLPVVKYDIPIPGGGYEERYWQAVHSPVLDQDNKVIYIIQRAEDVTANEALVAQLESEQKALKETADSEKRYSMILMKSPFGFAVFKGKDMVITLANDSIKAFWGKGDDLEGKPLFDVLHELRDSAFPTLLDQVYTTGIPYYGDETPVTVMRHGILEDAYYNFVYQPYLEAEETISGVTVIAYDVTKIVLAHKKIQESEAHFRQMADLMPAKISNADPAGNVTYFNKHWLDYSGYSFEDLRDFGYHKMMHPDEVDEFAHLLQKSSENGTVLKMEMRFMNKAGDYRWHLNLASPIMDENGNIKMWVGSTTDIHEQKTVSEKIKTSEERFRLLVMQAPVAICVLRGADYIVETINKDMLAMWDKKKAEAINRPAFDVLPEYRDHRLKALLNTVYTTGTRFVSQEVPLAIHRNGRLQDAFIKFACEPMREADGSVSGIMILAHEVTEQVNARKRIEVSEKKFRLLTDAMPQKITNADADGNVTFFNQKWMDDTGLTFEELKDWGWEKAMHPDDMEITVKNWRHSVATGEIFDMECRIQNKEGGYRWNLSRAVPIRDEAGKIIMWVGSNTDIHELKEAKSKAEAAMKAKQLFLSNMSHEIRTPMNAVIGFTNVILKTQLTEKQKEYVDAIKVSGDALIVLINDILDIAKVDAGKMTFEQTPFALIPSISATLHLFEPKITEKNIALVTEYDTAIPEMVEGDPVRLRQIILNLLSNAVKFTDKGKITVSVRMLSEGADDTTIEFLVADTGIGIPEDKLEYIFGDFQQASDQTSRLYGGTGLGLSIVKQFVELQGGTLIVHSQPGQGSTFGFVLGFKKAATEAAEIAPTDHTAKAATAVESIRVLVAEDMPLNQLLIKIILKDFGFEVDIATNGKMAIEMLQQNKYDIILMDLLMPEINGFEATAHIRSQIDPHIPIIALTADVTTVDLEKCTAIGMNDYMSKPVDEKILYTKIMKYLTKSN